MALALSGSTATAECSESTASAAARQLLPAAVAAREGPATLALVSRIAKRTAAAFSRGAMAPAGGAALSPFPTAAFAAKAVEMKAVQEEKEAAD